MTKNSLLIADDDVDFRNYIVDLLEGISLKIIQANNGKEAVNIFLNEHIDFIISDLEMPEMNGLEFLKIIREKKSSVPFLLTTGSLDYSKKYIISLGANFFISKLDINTDIVRNFIENFSKNI